MAKSKLNQVWQVSSVKFGPELGSLAVVTSGEAFEHMLALSEFHASIPPDISSAPQFAPQFPGWGQSANWGSIVYCQALKPMQFYLALVQCT